VEKNSPKVLIVGGDAFLSQGIQEALAARAIWFVKTTRRSTASKKIYLDLLCPEDFLRINFRKYSDVIFLAGITRIQDCEEDKKISHSINVDNTFQLAQAAAQGKCRLIAMSSSLALGLDLNRSKNPDDWPEYGRQKLRLERKLQALTANLVLLRPGKILGYNHPLISNWMRRLSQGNEIYCFSNKSVSPISDKFIGKLVADVVESDFTGLINICASSQVSYYELALRLAKKMGVSSSLVRKTKSKLVFQEPSLNRGVARSGGLDNLQIQRPSIDSCLEDLIA